MYGEEFKNKSICFHDLKSLSQPRIFLKALEQKIHNLGATNKDFRYKEILKILLTKYYDEIQNKKRASLHFQFFYKEKDHELRQRRESLYNHAFLYYSSNTPIKLEKAFHFV